METPIQQEFATLAVVKEDSTRTQNKRTKVDKKRAELASL